jgi:hypothetical protein
MHAQPSRTAQIIARPKKTPSVREQERRYNVLGSANGDLLSHLPPAVGALGGALSSETATRRTSQRFRPSTISQQLPCNNTPAFLSLRLQSSRKLPPIFLIIHACHVQPLQSRFPPSGLMPIWARPHLICYTFPNRRWERLASQELMSRMERYLVLYSTTVISGTIAAVLSPLWRRFRRLLHRVDHVTVSRFFLAWQFNARYSSRPDISDIQIFLTEPFWVSAPLLVSEAFWSFLGTTGQIRNGVYIWTWARISSLSFSVPFLSLASSLL